MVFAIVFLLPIWSALTLHASHLATIRFPIETSGKGIVPYNVISVSLTAILADILKGAFGAGHMGGKNHRSERGQGQDRHSHHGG